MEVTSCKKFSRQIRVHAPVPVKTCRAGARTKDGRDDWSNMHVLQSLLLAAALDLYLPPQSLPLSKHQCLLSLSLSLACLQAVSPRQAALTDQPELQRSREAFEVCSNQHRSGRELPRRGLVVSGVGVGCINANVTNMKMDYSSIQSSTLGVCTSLKIALVHQLFISVFEESLTKTSTGSYFFIY